MPILLHAALLATAATLASHAGAVSAYIAVFKPETCGNANGALYAGMNGSPVVHPLTYAWSNGATTQLVEGLAAGTYSVTITDGDGVPYTVDIVLPNVDELPFTRPSSPAAPTTPPPAPPAHR